MAHQAYSRRRRADALPLNLARWLFENQITRRYTSKLLTLSYYNNDTGKYAIGYDDFYLMALCVVVLTGLRASVMHYVLAPCASRWGVSSKKDATRFAEQGWMVIYYNICWSLGMYLYSSSKYFLRMEELWTDWPEREIGGLMKFYFIGQWSFWMQQILIINMEERRKDHWPMLIHHFVTIFLLAGSYAYHLTRVANLILILMDVIDLFLPLAKCLKYLGFTTICDVLFFGFLVSWVMARHVLYVLTCWSVYFDFFRVTPPGCYYGSAKKLQGPIPLPTHGWSHLWEPFRNPAGIICASHNIMYTFLSLLLFLQVLMLTWFAVIVKVVIRMLSGKSAEDLRSNSEGVETEQEQGDEDRVPRPLCLEKECKSEMMDWNARERRVDTINVNNDAGGSTSVSCPTFRNRKELLNRIGCEKQID
ncbi:hypothetical protein E4U42_006871 [Claviceps africana]|uniref:TLC domain-containing protein n=1 Tax=Claviceps africana TaxID=83212 RepID=A0A8K0NET3_9HYPO|nr:hypothetical protein E4U42_006871 [Claviceps africana]